VRLRHVRRSLVVSAVFAVLAVGLGAAAAAGAFASAPAAAPPAAAPPAAAPPAAATSAAGTVHATRALPQDDPTSALMRRVLTGGQLGTITPATPQAGTLGRAAAGRAALVGLRAQAAGARILGAALAYVTQPGLGRHRPMWLVSVDLAGGLTNPGGPDSAALKPDNYTVVFVDATTGQWHMMTAGNSPSLPSLPLIRG
jgi:hypothetical protein